MAALSIFARQQKLPSSIAIEFEFAILIRKDFAVESGD
ncbi:MAG: hypothetical protein GQF41_4240 [Candidatus Rifleibacterium amylolyticum]|nr:MAG: hypothetical protein GQF41_4240 [Candidatus Rifleibacterium amylolyticum]